LPLRSSITIGSIVTEQFKQFKNLSGREYTFQLLAIINNNFFHWKQILYNTVINGSVVFFLKNVFLSKMNISSETRIIEANYKNANNKVKAHNSIYKEFYNL